MEKCRIIIGVAVIILFALPISVPAGDMCSEPVMTTEGPVAGREDIDSSVCSYKGIPYALPPLGELRYKAPEPPLSRSSIFEAYEFSPSCMQDEAFTSGGKSRAFSEDCLYLNIWRPGKNGTFPVMFWIHGGGYMQGAGTYQMYHGGNLAAKKDVVVVSINYRLDALGFLVLPELSVEDPHGSTGNYGLLDTIRALEWVRDNISAFGGDPGNVTIFGESAGGLSVCTLLASAPAQGLFHKAIIESGGCDLAISIERALKQSASVVDELGCAGNDVISCMRGKPAEKIVKLKDAKFKAASAIDGYVLTDQPINVIKSGNFNKVPIIVGSNKDELNMSLLLMPGSIFATRGKLEKLMRKTLGERTDDILDMYSFDDYRLPIYLLGAVYTDGFASRAYAAAEEASPYCPVYYYRFDWDEERLGKSMGAFHGLEIPLVFGNLDLDLKWSPLRMVLPRRAVKRARPLSENMMSYWTNFAGTGNPNGPGLHEWPEYNISTRQRIYLDSVIRAAPLTEKELERYRYFSSITIEELGFRDIDENK